MVELQLVPGGVEARVEERLAAGDGAEVSNGRQLEVGIGEEEEVHANAVVAKVLTHQLVVVRLRLVELPLPISADVLHLEARLELARSDRRQRRLEGNHLATSGVHEPACRLGSRGEGALCHPRAVEHRLELVEEVVDQVLALLVCHQEVAHWLQGEERAFEIGHHQHLGSLEVGVEVVVVDRVIVSDESDRLLGGLCKARQRRLQAFGEHLQDARLDCLGRDVDDEHHRHGNGRLLDVLALGDELNRSLAELRPVGDVVAESVRLDGREVALRHGVDVEANAALVLLASVDELVERIDVGAAPVAAERLAEGELDDGHCLLSCQWLCQGLNGAAERNGRLGRELGAVRHLVHRGAHVARAAVATVHRDEPARRRRRQLVDRRMVLRPLSGRARDEVHRRRVLVLPLARRLLLLLLMLADSRRLAVAGRLLLLLLLLLLLAGLRGRTVLHLLLLKHLVLLLLHHLASGGRRAVGGLRHGRSGRAAGSGRQVGRRGAGHCIELRRLHAVNRSSRGEGRAGHRLQPLHPLAGPIPASGRGGGGRRGSAVLRRASGGWRTVGGAGGGGRGRGRGAE
mmetsp:Transcript_11937/g.48086  ORF Transcript_11937/g.48086 Transcript_11937/m.48086 type:complete len:573 (+) Transcript_11937:1157-2875(+)